MSTRKSKSKIQKKARYDYSSEETSSENEFSSDLLNPAISATEAGKSPQNNMIPKFSESEYEEEEENIEIKNPKKEPPPYTEEESGVKEANYSNSDEKELSYSKKLDNYEEEEGIEAENEETVNQNSEGPKQEENSSKDVPQKDKMDESNYEKSSDSPLNTLSGKFSTENLTIPSAAINKLEANRPQISSSDDSAYDVIKMSQIKRKAVKQQRTKSNIDDESYQQRKEKHSKRNEDLSDENYSGSDEEEQPTKITFNYSHSQASRKSRNSNQDNQSHSSRHSRREMHPIFQQNIYNDNNEDDDQTIRRRPGAKSTASSRRSSRTNQTNRTSRTNLTSPSHRSTNSKRSNITRDTWKEDAAKSVAQKENDRIDIILTQQYHVNLNEFQFEIGEKVRNEYEKMKEMNCKTIFNIQKELEDQMDESHQLNLDRNVIERFPRSKIRSINNKLNKQILEIQKKLDDLNDENKSLQKQINTIKIKNKNLDQNQTQRNHPKNRTKVAKSRK